jgi:hypothetical protein
MAYVRSLEIGMVCYVKEEFCYGLDDCEKVEGCYRHLAEFLPLLANFYLKLAEISGENLLWFDNEINRFHVVKGPLLGPFLDRAHIEPLHVKNNACQQMFRLILYDSISKSNFGPNVAHFHDVSNSTAFFRLVNCLIQTAKLACLAKKVKRWFNDTKGAGKDFQYRFTGQNARMFLHNSMFIIDSERTK